MKIAEIFSFKPGAVGYWMAPYWVGCIAGLANWLHRWAVPVNKS